MHWEPECHRRLCVLKWLLHEWKQLVQIVGCLLQFFSVALWVLMCLWVLSGPAQNWTIAVGAKHFWKIRKDGLSVGIRWHLALGKGKKTWVITAVLEVKKDQNLRQLKMPAARFLFSLQLKSSMVDDLLLFELIWAQSITLNPYILPCASLCKSMLMQVHMYARAYVYV